MTPHVWVVEQFIHGTGKWMPVKAVFTRKDARGYRLAMLMGAPDARLRIVKYGRMA